MMYPNMTMDELEEWHWKALSICVLQRRKEANLTQVKLAKKAGVSTSEIQHIERERRGPRTGTLMRVCVALGISLLELIAQVERVMRDMILKLHA